jgi:hypothetical protein
MYLVTREKARMNISELRDERVLPIKVADVGIAREVSRRRRLSKLVVLMVFVGVWLWLSVFAGHILGRPHLTRSESQDLPLVGIVLLVGAVMVVPMLVSGRSPHVRYRPEEIDVTLDDVKGSPVVVEEAVRTLNLFLAHATFRSEMGGTPRKGILFEGPPGTGKTHLAKALAREAGVPFFFVSSSAFQSMFYGQTNRKIRAFFTELRKAARSEGGAIGFIEEIDAIGASLGWAGPGRRARRHSGGSERTAHPAPIVRPAALADPVAERGGGDRQQVPPAATPDTQADGPAGQPAHHRGHQPGL